MRKGAGRAKLKSPSKRRMFFSIVSDPGCRRQRVYLHNVTVSNHLHIISWNCVGTTKNGGEMNE